MGAYEHRKKNQFPLLRLFLKLTQHELHRLSGGHRSISFVTFTQKDLTTRNVLKEKVVSQYLALTSKSKQIHTHTPWGLSMMTCSDWSNVMSGFTTCRQTTVGAVNCTTHSHNMQTHTNTHTQAFHWPADRELTETVSPSVARC